MFTHVNGGGEEKAHHKGSLAVYMRAISHDGLPKTETGQERRRFQGERTE
jgi:hypothetical protein